MNQLSHQADYQASAGCAQVSGNFAGFTRPPLQTSGNGCAA